MKYFVESYKCYPDVDTLYWIYIESKTHFPIQRQTESI